MFIVHPRVPILKCSPFIHPQRTEPSVRCCDLSNVSRNLVHPGWNDQVSAICCPRHEQICCQRHHEQTKGTACLGKNCIFLVKNFRYLVTSRLGWTENVQPLGVTLNCDLLSAWSLLLKARNGLGCNWEFIMRHWYLPSEASYGKNWHMTWLVFKSDLVSFKSDPVSFKSDPVSIKMTWLV